jgi:4-amino-4-deoxychorismate lyase
VALWRDGAVQLAAADEPVVTAFDQGLARGDGVFESVDVIGGGTPYLAAHLARLARSAALLELADPGAPVWSALVEALLEK